MLGGEWKDKAAENNLEHLPDQTYFAKGVNSLAEPRGPTGALVLPSSWNQADPAPRSVPPYLMRQVQNLRGGAWGLQLTISVYMLS